MTYSDHSTTKHLSAWDFHVLTLSGELDRSQLPDPIEPERIEDTAPSYQDIDDAFAAALAEGLVR